MQKLDLTENFQIAGFSNFGTFRIALTLAFLGRFLQFLHQTTLFLGREIDFHRQKVQIFTSLQ